MQRRSNRVAQTIDGVTTYFVGNYYEKTGSIVTKYYYSGGQRIAMRKNGTLHYMFSDHLGSTSITTDSAGNVISELRYKPWGEVRYNAGVTPTDYTFTGQMDYTSDFGLLFYNARWYDPVSGRMAQADSIVPGGVQGLDRYAYVNNAPTRFTDPSGHRCVPVEECDTPHGDKNKPGPLPDQYQTSYNAGLDFINILNNQQGDWSSYMTVNPTTTMIDYLIKVIVDFEGYSYSEAGVCQSAENSKCNFQKYMIEAVTRKVYDFYNNYGVDGLYTALGSYEVIRRRVDLYHGENKYNHNPERLKKPLDYLMTPFHFDRVESVWSQYFSSSWRAGASGDRPYDVGNPSIASPSLLAALRSNNVGPGSTQVLFISDDKMAFILTLDQASCHDPSRNLCP